MNRHDAEAAPAVVVPDHLQRLLGPGFCFADTLNPEKIAACEQVIEQARGVFFTEARRMVERMEPLLAHAAETSGEWEKIAVLAGELRAESGLLGYTLIETLAAQLAQACTSRALDSERRHRVAQRYIEALALAARKRIHDPQSAEGAALLRSVPDHF